MQKLVFGSKNPAKLRQVQDVLMQIGIKVIGLDELNITDDVEETGSTVIENARLKSVAYARLTGQTVLSMDNALYFDGLPDEEQPGIHARRVNGQAAKSDIELVEHYSTLVDSRSSTGRLKGWWEYGLSLAKPDGTSVETTIKTHRVFVSQPSNTAVEGYPLESIQVDPATGTYMSEMTAEQKANFWHDNIGMPMQVFVRSNT